MSHTATIKAIKIMDIAALGAAVTELASMGIKISLVPDSTPRAYSVGQKGMGKADYVISIPDAKYDVGLYKQPDGSYEPRTDFFMGSVAKVLGTSHVVKGREEQAQLGKLLQFYGLHAASRAATQQGKSVRRVAGKDGAIALEIVGY
ncbi:MAG: hypothetical protein RSE62_03145 [Citrobacter sp.]